MQPRVLAHDVRGEGEPLVLVPGGLTGWLSWIPHVERLAPRWMTVRVQPIHNELGSAGQPGDASYTAHTERESLRLTLEHLGLDRPHLAGWSAGGRALIEFALAHPEHVASLALVEPGAFWVLEQLQDADLDVDEATTLTRRLAGRVVTEDDLAEFLQLAGLAASPEAARDDPAWSRWVPHRMALSWQSEALETTGRSVDELAGISCPVLLVKGSHTNEWDRRIVDVLGKRIPRATVVELPGDHASHIQSLDAFIEVLERHLAAAG